MKKSHFLQTLYLQKPLFLILLIATLSTLPWIGLGDFYTKGEPREAALAVSMIEKGEWVIPSSYADEFAYKPPFNHWLIAGFSLALTHGEVTPFTSRLPSTIAFIAMIGVCFMFFARRRPVIEAFVSCLILITCFEIHRAAMTTRVDMVLTFLLVAAIIQMYAWYQKRRRDSLIFLTDLVFSPFRPPHQGAYRGLTAMHDIRRVFVVPKRKLFQSNSKMYFHCTPCVYYTSDLVLCCL